jgi:hypothetical protein
MSGGTISNNTARGYFAYVSVEGFGDTIPEAASGGGVYILGIGFMSGGTISGNTAIPASNGTVVWVGGVPGVGLSVTMRSSATGGGVWVSNSGSFTKSGGGIIYGNDATNTSDRNTATSGHTVYTSSRSRNATLGEADDISTNTQTGWGQ